MKNVKEDGKGYSPEVAGILSRKPAWIIRNGIMLVAIIFTLCLAGTWFIPWPERVSGIASFYGETDTSGNVPVLTGTIMLPVRYKPVIRQGMPVDIKLSATVTSGLISSEGSVATITVDSLSGKLLLTVLFRTEPRTAALFISANQCNAQITTGNSNLLRQVFNPVISLIKGVRNKQQ